MHTKDIRTAGAKVQEATRALILLHGRGAPAEDILGLANVLNVEGFAIFAPQATNHTWYPYSFLAPREQNEPWLSSAIALLDEITRDIIGAGILPENIFFSGFSQGACLALEFATRNAQRWGGIAAFAGGLIGDRIYDNDYKGDFESTPIFISSSDPDAHIPVERVRQTTRKLTEMGASLQEKIYKNIGHTITEEQIRLANEWVFSRTEIKSH